MLMNLGPERLSFLGEERQLYFFFMFFKCCFCIFVFGCFVAKNFVYSAMFFFFF